MGDNVARLFVKKEGGTDEAFSAVKRIEDARTPELVIALCGSLGTPLHRVADKLDYLLRRKYEYESVHIIRLSDFIRSYGNPAGEDIASLITAGNNLREEYGNSVLAQLAIDKICRDRGGSFGDEAQISLVGIGGAIEPAPVVKSCHIIDSIKNTQELNLLRSVYGEILHVISVYTPINIRVESLEKKLGSQKSEVFKLIDRDSGEEFSSGQSVRDVFPLADFFLRIDDGTDDKISTSLERYLDLLLGAKVVTPTAGERAMYAAYAAARNSACLSRQVGASIVDSTGNLISTGWNDVPKAFGGLYETYSASDDKGLPDQRCWNKDGGKCFNDEEKSEIADRLTTALVAEEIIDAKRFDEVKARLRRSSELKGLIEFSRAVHAEMHALLNAGHSAGGSIRGGKLFVTTYPCHSCARHIIAAGITEVRFIEPYRKSLATRLHSDAITEQESELSKVRIVPFDGVSPNRYLSLFGFAANGRKNSEGRMEERSRAIPVTAVTLEAIPTLEMLAVKELSSRGLLDTKKS